MTTTDSSLLHVHELAWGEIKPRAAFVHVTLTASKLFSGRAALSKSEELRRLVDALVERGLPHEAASLDGASLDVSTGLFSRSSSVTYRVRIHVTDLDLVAAVLETIADSKQATLTHIAWDHSGGAPSELLAECASRAAAKARRLAAALGVAIEGVHEIHEEEIAEREPVSQMALGGGMMMMARKSSHSVSHELAGLDLGPTKQVGIRVRVAYRLSRDLRSAT